MGELRLVAWDIGGVLLSNGWDHEERRLGCVQFGLDPAEFERRHESVVDPFERGRLSLDDYLGTVAPELSAGRRGEFRSFMMNQTTPNGPTIAFARTLAARGAYRMVALNDESRELNLFRIRAFDLASIFDGFFSSCFTGHRKPSAEAFRSMLDICQREASSVVFVDDRVENVTAARGLGLVAVPYRDPAQVQADLAGVGVRVS